MNIFLKIIPPLWMFGFFLVALAIHFLFPETRVFNISNYLVAIAILVVGSYLTTSASKLFAEEKTEILPTSPKNSALVTRGLYRYTRNPMYLGLILILTGLAVGVGSLPGFIAVAALFCVLNFVFIPFEEEKMLRQFGSQYEAYRESVRRWL